MSIADPVGMSGARQKASLLPIVAVALAQVLVVANVLTLRVSIGGMVVAFRAPATTVQYAIVVYSLVTAAFMILGGKLGALLGWKFAFQAATTVYGLGMAFVALSRSLPLLLGAEALAGLGAAVLVPSLMALIAAQYQGRQRALAVGLLGGSAGFGGALSLLIAGVTGTAFGWRVSFWVLVALAAGILALSVRLGAVPGKRDEAIDGLGVVLSASAVVLLTTGINNGGTWGVILALPAAPVDVFGLSPALVLVLAGVALGAGFFAWQRRRVRRRRAPLLSPRVVETPVQRSALSALLMAQVISAAVLFVTPLYIQITQRRSAIETAVVIIPYGLAIFFSATLVNRVAARLTERKTARLALLLVALGVSAAGIAIAAEVSLLAFMAGLTVAGVGLGSLLTVLSNVMLDAVPAALGGDVGALRGTVNNLGSAIGSAAAGVLLIIAVSAVFGNAVAASPGIRPEVKSRIDPQAMSFLSDGQLTTLWAGSGATAGDLAAARLINTESQVRALTAVFLALAVLALIGVPPCRGLPAGNGPQPGSGAPDQAAGD